jgi:CheY-like chemotaxis protein
MGPVLVIEDSPDTREVLALAIAIEGYEIVVAADGAEALEQLEEIEPCAILLDYHMPAMDGRAFRLEQKRRRLRLDVPVILYSADGAADISDMDLAVVLRKPSGIDEILTAVRELCVAG